MQELATEVMPAFRPDAINAKSGHRQGPMEVVSWLLPGRVGEVPPAHPQPVIEALGVLEHANLVTRRSFGSNGQASTHHARRLGETALAGDTVRQRLGAERS